MLRLIPQTFHVSGLDVLQMNTTNIKPTEIEGYSVRSRRTGIALPNGTIYDQIGFNPAPRQPADFWTVFTILDKALIGQIRETTIALVGRRGILSVTDPDTNTIYNAHARLVRAANNTRQQYKLIKTHQIKLTFELFTEFEPQNLVIRDSNLVQEWSFEGAREIGPGGPLDIPEWTLEFTGVSISNETKHGTQSLRLEEALPSPFRLYQDITVVPSRIYTISAWFWLSPELAGVPNAAGFTTHVEGSFAGPVVTTYTLPFTGVWQRATQYRTAETNTMRILFQPPSSDTGYCLIDAVKCYHLL